MLGDKDIQDFARDGVAFLPGLLTRDEVAKALALYEWSLAHPGPLALDLFGGDAGFRQDLVNPDAPAHYETFLKAAPFSETCAQLWGAPSCWFMYEQVFLKDARDGVARTPWHQDLPYLAIEGPHLAVFWISFEKLSASQSLEFIKGSHNGPLYNGSRFDPADETAPLYPSDELPRLPQIENNRTNYDIVSFAVEPGDVVVFHPAMLHGGAPTFRGAKRRTLTLRFFGEEARFAARPFGGGEIVPGLFNTMKPGDPFRHEAFLQLH